METDKLDGVLVIMNYLM